MEGESGGGRELLRTCAQSNSCMCIKEQWLCCNTTGSIGYILLLIFSSLH